MKQPVRDFLRGRDPEYLAQAALQVLDGEIRLADVPEEDRTRFKDGFLRWAAQDRPVRQREWNALGRVDGSPDHERLSELVPLLEDRDRYVETLWRRIQTEDRHSDLRELYTELGARTPYQRALVDRFVRRFDLTAALRTSEARWSSPWLFVALFAFAAVLAVVVLQTSRDSAWIVGAGIVGLGVMGLVTGYATDGDLGTTTQVLLPRLAVGITIGYLFLAAAPHLLAVVATQDVYAAVLLGALLLAATYGYTVFHIWRRVQPGQSWSRLAGRAVHVLAIGGSYAILQLLLVFPLLSSPAFFGGPAPDFAGPDLVLLAAVALALGMVLELAWQEKPLTEPL